ncbi:MAG: chromosomal replication initiator DnaA [Devosia sp.]|nr:chromosomal replication initiator DnaA [Devosia sp.]
MLRQAGARGQTPNDAGFEQVIALVAQQKSIAPELIRHHSRCAFSTARARQLAMYLSHVALGRTLTQVGMAFGRDRTTVSYACALIEDMRDDPRFDNEVCELEGRIEAMIGSERGSHHAH